jgi:hypothetical protein
LSQERGFEKATIAPVLTRSESDQERRQILEMVVAGALTVEQAGESLERLDAERSADTEKPADQGPAGFSRFTRGQIAMLRDHEVDAAYIQGLEAAGLGDLSVKQLIALKDYVVDAEFIAALREAGFVDVTVKQLIALKTHDVEAGLTNLTAEQLIALKNYDVDAEYLAALREIGLTGLTVKQLIALKELG